MANVLVWFYLSRMTLWAELTDPESGIGLDGATVEVTIVDADLGTEVGEGWPVEMTDEGGGLYKTTFNSDLEVEAGAFYRAKVKAVAASGADRYAEPVIKVVVDES